jgi:ribosomal-protein-alanine N-acetyltransferase
MNILTERLSIREVNIGDSSSVLKAAECPQISLMHSNEFTDIDMVRKYIEVLNREYETGKYITLAVADKASDILIGLLTLDIDRVFPRAEVSYWIDMQYRNTGYATEAVGAIIDYGFTHLKLNRIQAMHFRGNDASGRVLIKAGMTYEGTLRQYVGIGSTYYDCLMYSVIKRDSKI